MNIRSTSKATRLFEIFLISFSFLFSFTMQSQPSLQFPNLFVTWPEVKLYVQAKCDTNFVLNLTANNFKITENGWEINDFIINCPDSTIHTCMSVALVLDKSGSMQFGNPQAIYAEKSGSKAFVDMMNNYGVDCDEATVISFNEKVSIDVTMTKNKVLLKNGIEGLVADGSTAVWDAGVVGINEVANNGTQEIRAVILATDGEDNYSSNTIDDIIYAALQNHVRVLTIGIGTAINEADLQRLAMDTGGRYYKVLNTSSLINIYTEIYNLLSVGFHECILNYNASCMDGTRRNVAVTLQNVFGCQGANTKIRTYKAPKDTSTFTPMTIRLESVHATGNQIVNVPLILETPINSIFGESTFNIQFDTTCCKFLSIDTLSFLLDSTNLLLQQITNGISISTQKVKRINGSGILAILRFQVDNAPSSSLCPITLSNWKFKSGCLSPRLYDGEIILSPAMTVTNPTGGDIYCSGDTMKISWAPPIKSVDIDLSDDGGVHYNQIASSITDSVYKWYIPTNIIGGTAFKIRVHEHGNLPYLGVSNSTFSIAHAPTILVQPNDKFGCINSYVKFVSSASGFPQPTIQWQESFNQGQTWSDIIGFPVDPDIIGANRDTLMINHLQLSRSNSYYRARFGNYCDSMVVSNAAILTVYLLPTISTQPVDQHLCEGDSVSFTVGASNVSRYQWYRNGMIANAETLSTIKVTNLREADNGDFFVIVSNPCGQLYSRTANLNVEKPPIILQHPTSQTTQENTSVTFSVIISGKNVSYQWMKDGVVIPGATKSSYTISSVKKSDEGNYSVRISGYCGNPITSNSAQLNVIITAVQIQIQISKTPILFQSYPNPFTQKFYQSQIITISFWLPKNDVVRLDVIDMMGRKVETLTNTEYEAGYHSIPVDATKFLSGLYRYQMQTEKFYAAKMMTIMK